MATKFLQTLASYSKIVVSEPPGYACYSWNLSDGCVYCGYMVADTLEAAKKWRGASRIYGVPYVRGMQIYWHRDFAGGRIGKLVYTGKLDGIPVDYTEVE